MYGLFWLTSSIGITSPLLILIIGACTSLRRVNSHNIQYPQNENSLKTIEMRSKKLPFRTKILDANYTNAEF